MPRTAIPVQTLGATTLELEDVAFTAADAANDHEFENNGRSFLIVKNDSGGPQTTTIVSQKTELRGSPNKSIVTAASKISVSALLPTDIFNTAGKVNVDLTADTSISYAVVSLP
jgi:hypothetical protein